MNIIRSISNNVRRQGWFCRYLPSALIFFFAVQGKMVFATEAGKLALVGGTVIQATGAPAIENAVLLVENGTITYLGKQGSVKIPVGFEQIDIKGKWVTPGLIDSNSHLILNIIPEFYVKYEDRLEEVALQSAQVSLKYGLTTIGDTWGPLEPLLKVRDKINKGDEVGTRVLVAGNIIGTGGPFSAYFMGGWDMRGNSLRYGGWVHPAVQSRINQQWEMGVGPNLLALTPEEIGKALREYIARGVDFIKVGVSGHGLGAVEPLAFSEEALEVMREEAKRAGIPFTTHTMSIASTKAALDLDTDFLVHPNVMNLGSMFGTDKQRAAIKALAKRTADKGMYAGLMAIPNKEEYEKYIQWDPKKSEDYYVNKIMADRGMFMTMELYEAKAKGVRVWLDAGVKYTIATDSGPETKELGPTIWARLGRAHFERMEAFQQLGEKPEDILIAATRNGAAAYNLQASLGTIEKGKIADLLILNADPHADIKNLRKINTVIKEGKVINRDRLPTIKVLDYDPEAEWPY